MHVITIVIHIMKLFHTQAAKVRWWKTFWFNFATKKPIRDELCATHNEMAQKFQPKSIKMLWHFALPFQLFSLCGAQFILVKMCQFVEICSADRAREHIVLHIFAKTNRIFHLFLFTSKLNAFFLLQKIQCGKKPQNF